MQKLTHLCLFQLVFFIHLNSKFDLVNSHVHCKPLLGLCEMMQHLLDIHF
jgi:hypothetical protein